MTIKVASYLMGIPPGNKNPEKPAIIVNFIEGVWKSGDDGTIVTDYTPVDADVAVVQGYVHPGSKNVEHLNLRKAVFEKQQREGKRSIIVDSNLFLYADPNNKNQFLRYSYDGIFPNTGEYCNENPDPSRWDKISRLLGISLKPMKTGGNFILICCQRDGGWSMNGQQLMPWLVKTIKHVQKFSDRPIVVRFHPGDKKILEHKRTLARFRMKKVSISNNVSITQDLNNAHAVINYNSSPAVAAAIEGVPVFVLDPERSQAAPVAHHGLAKLENPQEFDREKWVQQMAQMHWTLDELKDGTAWRHLRKWAKK
jgi:fructose-specific component phosphotransferase system IIB-like protein